MVGILEPYPTFELFALRSGGDTKTIVPSPLTLGVASEPPSETFTTLYFFLYWSTQKESKHRQWSFRLRISSKSKYPPPQRHRHQPICQCCKISTLTKSVDINQSVNVVTKCAKEIRREDIDCIYGPNMDLLVPLSVLSQWHFGSGETVFWTLTD